jgi:hypothetical protein
MGKNIFSHKWLIACILSISMLVLASYVYSQAGYPYTSGQAVFVQSPFNSSLYTTYNYRQHETAPQRLPPYTTNQAVFIQQPYASAQQTVTSYPSSYFNTLPYSENRYTSPAAYPTTTAPPYPFGEVGFYVASPYQTTTQSATYHYPYLGRDYTTTYIYPYTTSVNTIQYPPPTLERGRSTTYGGYGGYPIAGQGYSSYPAIPAAYPANTPPGYPSTTYYGYPITTAEKYPYPVTTTAVPEIIVEPGMKR